MQGARADRVVQRGVLGGVSDEYLGSAHAVRFALVDLVHRFAAFRAIAVPVRASAMSALHVVLGPRRRGRLWLLVARVPSRVPASTGRRLVTLA
eukprot:5239513-Pleurochrysis_carterae.AAC.1